MKKTANKTTPTETAKADVPSLRRPQVRILAALAKSKAPLTRKELAIKAPVDLAGCTEWIGSSDPKTRKANDSKHFKSLVTLAFVTMEEGDEGASHTITELGRKALANEGKIK